MLTFTKRLLILFALLLVVGYFAWPTLTDQWIKHSLKAPPPFKTLENVQGISIASPSGIVKYPQDYTIVLVGDSMTEALGNSDELKGYLNQYYPDKTFEVLNYGYGSTNILSLPERFSQTTNHGREFRPIDLIDFNLIILESMGYNPLSQFSLKEGLQKQNETLDQLVKLIQEHHPQAKIAFLATIAPNYHIYAQGVTDLSEDQRKQWVEERDAYIQNHIDYANSHSIPVIDAFNDSKGRDGQGRTIFIRNEDHIHPSPTGTLFISREIADYIFRKKLY